MNQRLSLLYSAIILLIIVSATARSQGMASATSALARAGVRFTENRGQVVDTRGDRRPDILYTAGVGGMKLFFRRDGVSYVFQRWTSDSSSRAIDRAIPQPEHERSSGTLSTHRVDMQLIGADERAEVTAESPTGSYSNYYLPQCPDGITRVESYTRITYREIYPHIDLVFHGNEDGLKYDFVVRPGGHISDIRWRYVGADGVTMTKEGGIDVASTLGTFGEDAPYAYQKEGAVACRYRRSDGTYGFTAGAYDARATLVIDPTVQWSIFMGGSAEEVYHTIDGRGTAVDYNGGLLICGGTKSADFPVTPGAMFGTNNGRSDMWIAKVSGAGAVVWSTYWGGSADDWGESIQLDSTGGYVLCGTVESPDIPIGGAVYQQAPTNSTDILVGRLDPGGLRRWGMLIGGTRVENAYSLAVDAWTDIIVSGATASEDFPLFSPFQPTYGGGFDVAIVKINLTGSVIWSTYYGGAGADHGEDIAVNPAGEIVVGGATASTNLPMYGTSFQRVMTSPVGFTGYILRLHADGSPYWSTYYGGNFAGWIYGVALDDGGGVSACGVTLSTNLPTSAKSFQRTIGSPVSDGFITRLDSTGHHRWSTYFGGTDADAIVKVIQAPNTDLLLAARTGSNDFPITPDAYRRTISGARDAALIHMDTSGTRIWSSYYGGDDTTTVYSLAVGAGAVYISGLTTSTALPALLPGSPPHSASQDGFIAKLDGFCVFSRLQVRPSGAIDLCAGDSVTLDAGAGYTDYRWSPGNQTTRRITVKQSGSYTVTIHDRYGCQFVSAPVPVRVNSKPIPSIIPLGPIILCAGDSAMLSARNKAYAAYRWSTGETSDTIWVKTSGTYKVDITDTNGCEGGTSVVVRVDPRPARPTISALDTIRICTDSVLRLDAGAGHISYRWWPNGERTQRITAKGSGTYYVEVGNASGCSIRSDSVEVLVAPRPEARVLVEGSTEFCVGDSVVLRMPPGLLRDPVWSRRDTTDAITVKSSGLYWVTVTDTNGCRVRLDSVRVMVHPALNPTITGPSTVCANTTPSYGASSVGTLRYEWSISGSGTIQGASDGKSITVQWGASGSGTITLRITDTVTGCVVTGTRAVTIGGELKPVIAPASITLCEGDSVELDAGSGYTTYAWSNGATSQTIWVKDTLGYSVEVVDPTGCRGRSDTVHARIEKKPVVVIDGAVKVCRSTTVTYSARDNTGASYQWTVSGGSISSGDGTSSVTVQWGTGTAGVITLRMTSAAGCTGETTMNVEIGSELKPTIAASGPLNLCAPDSVELDAGSGYTSYLWSPGGEISQKIMVSTAGIYSVTVQDASGCGGTSDPVQVAINPRPSVAITPSGPLKLKRGDSIALDAGAGHAGYRWSTGAATQRIMVKDSGSYSVTVTDANGCTATATVRIDLDDIGGRLRLEVLLGHVSGVPGARVEVPVTVIASDTLSNAGVSSYTARIRYRASVLEPTGATPRGALDGDDRVISVSGAVPAGMASGELARIAFIAAMGDTDSIPLDLEEVLWHDASGSPLAITTALDSGSFTLVGLCTNGGVRLVSTGGAVALRIVGSNPVHDLLDVEYELIEAGHHDLILYDILGREVSTLMMEGNDPGSGEARCDASSLAEGLYLLVLRTPTARLSLPVRVVR